MTKKQILFAAILVDFVVFSVWAFADTGGIVTAFEAVLATAAGWQVALDLVIALSIGLAWVYRDARRRQLPFWPFAALTLLTGSIGLLAYLVVRERRPAPAGPEKAGLVPA